MSLRLDRIAIAAGLGVFVLASVLLVVTNGGRRPAPPLPRSELRPALLRNPETGGYLRARHWTSVKPVPLDESNWRVTVFDGQRSILDATVDENGQVSGIAEHPNDVVPFASRQIWSPALLVLLSAAFAAALMVTPLRSMRNADALVLGLGFCLELILYSHRLVAPHIFAASATMAYIVVRATRTALSPPRDDQTPLWAAIRARLGRGTARRFEVLGIASALFLGLLLTITSTGISDIALVNLSGGTLLSHGTLPYGNFPPALGHGDTYPLFSYLFFLPSAALWPVSDAFDDLQGALDLNALVYVASAAFLYKAVAGYTRDRTAGALVAFAWLVFPPVLVAASAGSNDVPAAAFVALALALWRRPAAGAGAVAAAAWIKVVPVVALPVYVALYSRRRTVQALAGVAAVCGAGAAILVTMGGGGGIGDMIDAMRFQTERGSLHAIWWQFDALWPQRLFEAATCGFIAAAALLVMRREALRTLPVVAALSGAAVVLVQLAGNYWNATYLPWALPLLLVGLFAGAGHRAVEPHSQVT